MKPSLVPATVLFCALPFCAVTLRAQDTGTSHPEQIDDSITTQSAAPHYAKPSPAVPMTPSQTQRQTYPNGEVQDYQAAPAANQNDHYVKPRHDDSSYVPYTGATTGTTSSAPRGGVIHQPVSSLPPNEQLADQPAGASSYNRAADPQLSRHDDETYRPYNPTPSTAATHHDDYAVTDDPTSGVVMDVPTAPNQIPQATLLRARLVTTLSTRTTKPGDRFTATLAGDVVRNGRVLLPYGSVVHGHVTAAHGGHGVTSAAVLRLEATSISLPDGTSYPLMAEVVDLRNVPNAHVTSEGTIKDNAMNRTQAAVLGGTTGGGAIAGALVGGGVGAVVGATIGAGVGTVLYLRRDREQILPARSELIFALDTPLSLNVEPQGSTY